MALHIDEITIGMHVSSGMLQEPRNSGGQSASEEKPDTETLVRECVQRVLRALKQERER